LQFAYFFNRFPVPQKDRSDFLVKIKNKGLVGNDIIFPIPDDAPEEIPFMFLQQSEEYEIRFSRGRIDFFLKSTKEKMDDVLGEFKNKIKILHFVLAEYQTEITDIGCVFRFVGDDKTPNNIFKKVFYREGIDFIDFSTSATNFIQNKKQATLDINSINFSVNQIKTVKTVDVPEQEKRLVVEYDMNTRPERIQEITEFAQIESFVTQEHGLASEFLKKLTPESDD